MFYAICYNSDRIKKIVTGEAGYTNLYTRVLRGGN